MQFWCQGKQERQGYEHEKLDPQMPDPRTLGDTCTLQMYMQKEGKFLTILISWNHSSIAHSLNLLKTCL